eukprot:scaffold13474_cov107-Amphora_coffeaeformis.AAC.1
MVATDPASSPRDEDDVEKQGVMVPVLFVLVLIWLSDTMSSRSKRLNVGVLYNDMHEKNEVNIRLASRLGRPAP